MDWSTVLSSEAEDVEKNEELLERLYGFFLQTDLPQQGSYGVQTERTTAFQIVSSSFNNS